LPGVCRPRLMRLGHLVGEIVPRADFCRLALRCHEVTRRQCFLRDLCEFGERMMNLDALKRNPSLRSELPKSCPYCFVAFPSVVDCGSCRSIRSQIASVLSHQVRDPRPEPLHYIRIGRGL